MNWERLIRLMMPIRLRRGRCLQLLTGGLTEQTKTTADAAEQHKEAEKEGARRIGQKMVVEEWLRERYNTREITIRGQEDGKVVLFGVDKEEEEYVRLCGVEKTEAVLITSVEETDVGCDFVVVVPPGVDKQDVAIALKGVVLTGVGYRVTDNQ